MAAVSKLSCAMFVLVLGCGSSSGPMGPSGTATDNVDGGSANNNGTGSSGGTPAVSGVPCEVATLLASYCVNCHGNTPNGGAPISLASFEDLVKKSPEGLSYAELSLMLMRDPDMPMPPAGKRPSADEIAAFEAWVSSGMMGASCDSVPANPYDTKTVCSTESYWTRGNDESPRMHPGVACIDCHTRGVNDDGEIERGPRFGLAGTVYKTAHEPDDCNGADGEDDDIVIEVTDARGKVVRMRPNRAGNFYLEDSVTTPITARVLYQGRVREMLTPQDSGDCNACHTEKGESGAPGRVMLP